MAALIALGMMRPVWMIVVGLAIFGEKVLPFGHRLAPVFGALMIVAGLAVAAGVLHVGPTMEGM